MKNVSKIIFVIIVVSIGAFAFSARPEFTFSAESSAAENVSNAPRDLYIRNCARCHGADGKSENELGQTLDATDLTTNKTSVKRNVQVITKGIGAMPAFGKKLKKTDITALANYVRGL